MQLAVGTAFVASSPDGPTAVVLLGRGHLQFSPADPSERTQLAIFSGAEQLGAEFDAVMIRIRPTDFAAGFPAGTLTARAAAPGDAKRAASYFDEYIGKTLNVDLNDLSRDRWSLVPQEGDLIAEIRTKRFGNLTYARSQSDPEDVSFFDRRRKKNIAIYASAEKLATRGSRFFSEDDSRDYDVTNYDLEADFSPDRLWIDGKTKVSLTVTAPVISSLTLRIADTLVVRSVFSAELGRLMYLRDRRPERGDRELPDAGAARHGVGPAGGLWRTDRAAGARSRGARPSTRRIRSRSSCCPSHATSTAIAATGIRRPRWLTTRRRGWRSRCRPITTRSPAARRPDRRHERPDRCGRAIARASDSCSPRIARCAISLASSAASTSSPPRSSCCRRVTSAGRRAPRTRRPTARPLALPRRKRRSR